ncbi:MAG TPA: hypothetical protein PLD78_16640 [Burkholderiaceae bacterium]|jgi:hypothetical protein|nr:hypothetical protein [Rhodoferax sp.]MBK7548468.1 hypothetical protein [Rhodoferax sp.]MBP8136506.1 hypothetical protein [Rhodoferax sp.]HPW09272.1 hypothetical protein [Burkholderiaceae bacterium]
MNWKTSKFASSMLSLLRSGDSVLDASPDHRIEDIRRTMVECLRDVTPSDELTHVRSRVLYGRDVQSLWYVRSDVMNLIAGTHGETLAREQLVMLTDMFRGLLPKGLDSRRGGLFRG